MADMHTPLLPWRADGNCDDWSIPSNDTAGVSGCAPIVDERGEVVAFAVGVGWNDDDAHRRNLIITAVNERPALLARASQDAETVKALRGALEDCERAVNGLTQGNAISYIKGRVGAVLSVLVAGSAS